MRTDGQREGPAGDSHHTWRDERGQDWTVDITWGFIGGRVECVGMTLDSSGSAAITSVVVREAERFVRSQREPRGKAVEAMALIPGEVGRRAARQVGGYQARSVAEQGGGRRDDALWRRRAEVMRAAWEKREPMSSALQALEPDRKPDTIRKIIDRARAWDAETGAGLLDGVGRPQKKDKK